MPRPLSHSTMIGPQRSSSTPATARVEAITTATNTSGASGIPNPIPLAAPVTTATFSTRFAGIGNL